MGIAFNRDYSEILYTSNYSLDTPKANVYNILMINTL
jgi:hypothetical protein